MQESAHVHKISRLTAHTFKGHAAFVAATEEAALTAPVDTTLFSPTVVMVPDAADSCCAVLSVTRATLVVTSDGIPFSRVVVVMSGDDVAAVADSRRFFLMLRGPWSSC